MVAAVLVVSGAQAQERTNNGINPLSVRDINEADIMKKLTIWRRVDLREKINQPMFSKNNEISRYLIDAVKAGLLDAYSNDSLTKKMTLDDFQRKLIMPNQTTGLTAEEIAAGFATENPAGGGAWDDKKPGDKKAAAKADDPWGAATKTDKKTAAVEDDPWGAPKKKTGKKSKKGAKTDLVQQKPTIDSTAIKAELAKSKAAAMPAGDEYFPTDLYVMEVREDWIFDKKRSRNYNDIQTITIFIPADKNPAGLEIPLAAFKFKDLDKLFRSDPKKFIWYNDKNTAQHRNLADAFDLRLFNGRLTKYSNPLDQDIVNIYKGEKEGLLKSIQFEHELMEYEHSLWEH